jgi:hypothetical protein
MQDAVAVEDWVLIQIKHEQRECALAEITATIKFERKEAILAKMKV